MISGTPSTTQFTKSYLITATNANGNGQTTITITLPVMIVSLVRCIFNNGSMVSSGSLAFTFSTTEGGPIRVAGIDGDTNGAYHFELMCGDPKNDSEFILHLLNAPPPSVAELTTQEVHIDKPRFSFKNLHQDKI